MNPEIKKNWIAALRSGEYTQGAGSLRTHDNEYCCLGVLCTLAEKAGIVRAVQFATDGDWGYRSVIDEGDLSAVALPAAVMKWADIHENYGGEVRVNWNGFAYLTTANDRGISFSKIAEVIEEKL